MALETHERKLAPRTLLLVRLGVGLAQGLVLYALIRSEEMNAWPPQWRWLLEGLVLASLVKPLVFIGGVGAIRRLPLFAWTATAGAVSLGLGAYGVLARGAIESTSNGPAPTLLMATTALAFIAHHLIAASDADRRFVARYPTYFDIAWKHGVQLALAVLFVGVFWLVLWLGAMLFKIIGISALATLIGKPWFGIPATTTMFAVAIQLTDVRVGLIRGVRTVVLTLLGWLAPLMGLLAAAFLLTLPFAGLKLLWATKSATAMLLSSAAVLIVLINTAYQDGKADSPPPLVLRWATRLCAVVVAPLLVLAAYALSQRIGQYGLTPERTMAAACLLVGGFYAVGYLVAAVRPGAWLKTLEPTNVVTAWVAVAVLLALFTPLADPARLSAADQMARIGRKSLTVDRIDFNFLRFHAGRYGMEGLKTLAARGGPIGAKAKATLARTQEWDPVADVSTPVSHPSNITVYPKGAKLPADFMAQAFSSSTGEYNCLSHPERPCDAFQEDMDGDGTAEVLIGEGAQVTVYHRGTAGHWELAGRLGAGYCGALLDGLKAGKGQLVASPWKDIVVGGQRYPMQPEGGCDEGLKAGDARAVAPGPAKK